MRMPDIGPRPAQILGILSGTAAELREGIGDILVILGQVGMQHHPFVPRQKRGVAHQFPTDREGRTWRHANPAHGPLGRVVEGVDHPDAIVQNGGLVLDKVIGGKAARALPDAHSAARRVKAQPQFGGGVDRILQP